MIRRSKLDFSLPVGRKRSLQILITLAGLYAVLIFFEFPIVGRPQQSALTSARIVPLNIEEETSIKFAPVRPHLTPMISGLAFNQSGGNFSEIHRSAREAWQVGRKLFEELKSGAISALIEKENRTEENCPPSVVLNGEELKNRGKVMVLPCGLALGSYITLVAKPQLAHVEYDPKISVLKKGQEAMMLSQFMVELQGLKTVDGEEPPRILHFNPRIRGDWSGRAVIEQNTCYRMQWGTAQRCDGRRSRDDEETVDGQLKCEKWIRDDDNGSSESKTIWWLNRLMGRKKEVPMEWLYPFVEDRLFVLTLSAGLEGYHVNVDGRHITSFPHRTLCTRSLRALCVTVIVLVRRSIDGQGFVLEDATGLSIYGDLEVQSVIAASLPSSHPSYAPQRSLEMLPQWQASMFPSGPTELFIGILSAGNHFAERMAVRKSWMESVRKLPNVVARFFVALHGRNEVNVELKKEAEYFGDIVIVPYMDSYDLVVLKTVAICEYGIRTFKAKYVMKCDDDTFVRVDSVMKEIHEVPSNKSLYVGNINYHHKPLRYGKWAVTYEEWHEEDYPPYANGPGYVVSSDIANFILTEFENHTLRLFKMEDVSMGMWVEKFNESSPVEYTHSAKFCQFGCIDNYYTAHYQSPRQMACMWSKLQRGKPQCCNMR